MTWQSDNIKMSTFIHRKLVVVAWCTPFWSKNLLRKESGRDVLETTGTYFCLRY